MSRLTTDLYNRIQDLYSQLLVAANQTSASINCIITIGSITGALNDNCVINIRNVCRNLNDNLALLDLATTTILNIQSGGPGNSSLIQAYNAFRQQCIADSQVNQNISIQNIDLGVCKPRFRTELNFTNSGDAVSNCVIASMLKLSQNDPEIEEITLVETLRDNFMYIAIAILSGGILASALLFLTRRKVTIVWRRT